MSITVRKTTREDAEILRNMYAHYLHDLSAYTDSLKENSAGTYEFDSFSYFWEKEGVNPYFIVADGENAGFVLLLEPPFTKQIQYVINDFFLYKRFRGKGAATIAAQQIFEQRPGSYFVAQLEKNKHAIKFWHSTYRSLSIPYEEYEDQEGTEKIICQEFKVPV
ncbi:GNAT family N-acetyltransferase [Bacillus sp. EB01]|uniref:GNAT family N-acetyltransferase n=1 Tax=Bacillus sp. EB01 TaxID=1347086 RepID=UPI0005C4947F|nr:GNAT family N-acetyltransferase [Bacillus sp. EB01]